MLERYCFDCHDSNSAKAGIDLEAALDQPLSDQLALWEKSVRQLQMRLMPPLEEERPDEGAYDAFVTDLASALDRHAEAHPHPGRTESIRRLNRTEYANVIRDLLGVTIDVNALLPPDASSHGFDNITVSDLPPALLNRYVHAAQKISRQALGHTGDDPDGRTIRIRPDITQEGHVEGLPLGTRGGALISHTFPRAGTYDIRIHLARDRNEMVEGLRGTHELQVLVDGEVAAQFDVSPPKNGRDHTKVDAHLHARIDVPAGTVGLGVTFVAPTPSIVQTLRQPYESAFNMHRHPRRSPAIFQVSITGPFEKGAHDGLASRERLLGRAHGEGDQAARSVLEPLLQLAYRGKADERDIVQAFQFYRQGRARGGFATGMESALSAILVSPKFLFRVESDPPEVRPGEVYAVADLDLASRLAFFLWSSMPDEHLLEKATAGELSNPDSLAEEALRLLKNPRAHSLATNFAGQWLYLRNLNAISPDGRLYPDFDDNLRQAMRRETESLFESILREDRSVLDLLRTDHTFLNERLAKHYGIPHVYGERFRKVALDPASRRGGLLRHASILTVTSYANRTSPVLRGHWVLENLLGTPPPPPPPDVPALDDNPIDASLPVRERLAAHRADPACAQCHRVMDPMGFAFEHFDAVGQWRALERGSPVDATGVLPDGTPFDGMDAFEAGLLKRPEAFVRTLTEKLLIFALGRGIEATDAPAIRQIVRKASKEDFRFSSIIVGLVTSDPFTKRMTALSESP